jgi:signal peptidase II
MLGLALGAIIGGALGNVVDRLRFGAVVDFLDVYLPVTGWPHWPAFNVADSGVFLGVIFVLADGIFAGRAKT